VQAQRDEPPLRREHLQGLASEVERETRTRAQDARIDCEGFSRVCAANDPRASQAADHGFPPLAIAQRDAAEGPAAGFARVKHEMRPPAARKQEGRSTAFVAVAQRRVAERLISQRAAEMAN